MRAKKAACRVRGWPGANQGRVVPDRFPAAESNLTTLVKREVPQKQTATGLRNQGGVVSESGSG